MGTEAVLFALLEGNPMYVDVLIQTMHWTGEIVEDGPDIGRPGFDGPPTELTPDQDTKPYIRTMSEGPVLLLENAARWQFGRALWAAMERSEFYHLLIQRLLRWTAREARKTPDGIALGRKARKILSKMFPTIAPVLTRPISAELGVSVPSSASGVLKKPGDVNDENLKALLNME